MAGSFVVCQDTDNPRDIRFNILPGVTEIPREQLELRDQIDAALTVLRIAIPEQKRFEEYYRQLLSLAQAGLVGIHANPDLATRALSGLKQDVTAREAGRVKNHYMKALGWRSAVAVLLILGVWFVLYAKGETSQFVYNLMRFEIGTMAGVWLSFGTRKPVLKFEELHILEEDRLEPAVRLVFAGLLALVVALAFHLGVVTLKLGSLTTERIDSDPWAALFFGLLSGVSEKALSTNVSRQAASLIKG
jgi:hypothetical protein